MTSYLQRLSDMTMTVEEALEIQRRQIDHYQHLKPNLAGEVAAKTTADQLEPGKKYPIRVINQHVPRGGEIENMCGVDFGGE